MNTFVTHEFVARPEYTNFQKFLNAIIEMCGTDEKPLLMSTFKR